MANGFDAEMQRALEADGEKLAALTGEDHGPVFIADGHTPGPWTAKPKKGGEWYVDSNDWGIAIVCGGAGHEGPNGRSDQNARLIAAAPELLVRATDLIEILNDFRGDFTDPAFIDALELLEVETREAIAKAEGRS